LFVCSFISHLPAGPVDRSGGLSATRMQKAGKCLFALSDQD